MSVLRGALIGAGYFSRFHVDAWSRVPQVRIVAVCDPDPQRAAQAASGLGGDVAVFDDAQRMLNALALDFVDIATPPATHAALCAAAGARGLAMLCQKPLAPTSAEARVIAERAAADGARLMVHENFRWQPWHVELRRLLQTGALGAPHSFVATTRLGDGWREDAYLARQPYFRSYPRLLLYETGVHFVDVFRALFGRVVRARAIIRRHNPVIIGEDAALMTLEFESGAYAVWDANRYNESDAADPRYTFGVFRLEGSAGHAEVAADGAMRVKPLGQPSRPHEYVRSTRGFGGDCVFATFAHFIASLRSGAPFATEGRDYVETMRILEACYQ